MTLQLDRRDALVAPVVARAREELRVDVGPVGALLVGVRVATDLDPVAVAVVAHGDDLALRYTREVLGVLVGGVGQDEAEDGDDDACDDEVPDLGARGRVEVDLLPFVRVDVERVPDRPDEADREVRDRQDDDGEADSPCDHEGLAVRQFDVVGVEHDRRPYGPHGCGGTGCGLTLSQRHGFSLVGGRKIKLRG